MVSSDDEGETVPHAVSNYHFVDENDEPISFVELPIQWSEGERPDGNKNQIFLHGSADNGLHKIYKQVTAWKFDLSDAKPEISVLTKENDWIKLQKPRKSFDVIIRTILITVHCLHYFRKNPEASGKSLWDHLAKVFSLYEVRPSENDLVDHISLISEAVKREERLTHSEFLLTFIEEKPRKRKAFDELVQTTGMSGFIVDDMDDDILDDTEEDGSAEEEDMYDSVCAFCDNGGELLCCEGRCMRSFHATVEAGTESMCASLGLTDDQVEAIQNFLCKNCQYQQHQCFSCGKLGSSDKSSGAEVFSCVSATCGRFYHPQCVAKLLHRENESAAEELQKKISAGESFICPIHKCCICKQGENKKDPELQFAVCRRCPKSYHRKCLPRKIAFEDLEEEDIIQRAWEGLLPNRILIYCLKHEIDEEIGTPIRKHIKFPDVEKKKNIASEMPLGKEKGMLKKRSLASEDSPRERTAMKAPKQVEKLSSALKEGDSTKRIKKRSSGSDPLIKSRATDASRKSSRDNVKSVSVKADKSSTADENKISLGERLYNLMSKGKQDTDDGDLDRMVAVKPAMKKSNSSPHRLDADSERRLLALMKESKSSITLEKVIEKHKVPSTHAYQSKNVVDKTITQGKVEGAVEAVRTALQKLEAGCSIEDAKAVCEPEVLQHIVRWQSKLKVYLAPFLHGMRYTSFGRHFTKVEKLEAIVEKLHWYVQNGDMIVDFCCGANDFSWLMKRKLEETGKKCSYKNYDVIQPKNDFNFEKRDWMEVRPGELPIGSQLIMGLNPPFGVHAALANKFIDKALEFKPKLLILIVPPETERLDKKKSPYDLVWEDDELLSGKSFYLPGSVDVNDKQMDQWNKTPPPLYLWSRHDWTTKHKALAQKHGHLSRQQKELHLEENLFETQVPHDGDVPMLMDDHPVQNGEPELERIAIVTEGRKASSPRELERRAIATEGRKASSPRELERAAVPDSRKTSSPRDNVGKEGHENHGNGNNQSRENSKKRRRGKGQRGRGTDGVSSEEKQKGGRPPVREVHRGIPHHSPPNVTDGRSSLEGYPSNSPAMPSHREVREDAYRHFEPSISGSGSQFGTGYGITQASIPDDMARRYNLNSEQPYSTGTHRWSSGASPGQGPNSVGYRPYFSAIDEKYGMNLDTQSHFPHFGRQDPDSSTQRSSYLAGHDPGYGHVGPFSSTYLNLGSASQSSYSRMNTSTMDRYAPRLDELNPARISTLGSDPPMGSMNSMYDPRVPPPRFRADAMGFAPGPHHGFSHQSSSGWLNE